MKSRVARARVRLRSIAEEGIKSAPPALTKAQVRSRKRRDWKGVIIG